MTKFKTDISKQGKQFELVFTTDNKGYFNKVQSVARDCIDHKPITQFDRIKAMSVVELARFIAEKITQQECVELTQDISNITATHIESIKNCVFKEYLRWLESEVQGECLK